MKRALLLPVLVALAAVLSAAPGVPEFTPTPQAAEALERGRALIEKKDPKAAQAAFKEAIEAAPDFIAAHDAYAETRRPLILQAAQGEWEDRAAVVDKAMTAQYEEWLRRFPDSWGVEYGVGSLLYSQEDPGARPHLLAVVARQPGFAKVYQMLSFDAERWGDSRAGSEYMRKASEADPSNPDYAFYYASGLLDTDPARWESASLDVARRFPTSERGAQALYWLGVRAGDDARRIQVYEQCAAEFPAEKFRWSAGAMEGLFDAYLRTEPAKAVTLADRMASVLSGNDATEWSTRSGFARSYVEVTGLLKSGKASEAAAKLDSIPVQKYSTNAAMIALLRSEVLAAAGDVQGAYDKLADRYAGAPEDEVWATLVAYGARLGKSSAQVDADIWARRDAAAKPAPEFSLGLYTADRNVSLSDYRGKVVFLTFWFPGCGPCRGEFPHFETVVRRFKGRDVVYLGINGIRQQDAYVLPFMSGTDYSFTPLKGDRAVTGPQGYAVRGYPSNFLIDRNGRIIYRNFRAHDPQSELVLQRMIESLLQRS